MSGGQERQAMCGACGTGVVMHEDGVTYLGDIFHLDCFIHRQQGGVNHQRRLCRCYGGTLPGDPPSLTRREAARVATMYFRRGDGGVTLSERPLPGSAASD